MGVPVSVPVCVSVGFVSLWLSGCCVDFCTSSFGAGEGIKILLGGGRRLRDFDIFVVVFFL